MIKFLIQDVIFEDIEKVKEILTKLNLDFISIEDDNYFKNLINAVKFDEKDFVIPFLSISNMRKFSHTNSLNLFSNEHYKVSYYSNYFGELLLNSDYFILPFGEFKRRGLSYFQNIFGEVFIKPDSGNKSFTGQKIDDIDLFEKTYRISDFEMICISSVKEFQSKEFRFWISKTDILGYSSYSFDNDIFDVPCNDMIDFVKNKVIPKNNLEDFLVVDVVKFKDNFKIIEVNCFNTSGTYGIKLEDFFLNIIKNKDILYGMV